MSTTRQANVLELCRTLPTMPTPAEVPPRPDPYREHFPCGWVRPKPPRLKGLSGGESRGSPSVCSGVATPKSSAGKEGGPLRQKPSVTSLIRGPAPLGVEGSLVAKLIPKLRESGVSPEVDSPGPGEGRPAGGGPGPRGRGTSGSLFAKGRPSTQPKAPFARTTKVAAAIPHGCAKPSRLSVMSLPLKKKGSRAELAAGFRDISEVQANPSLSVSLVKYGAGPRGAKPGQAPAPVDSVLSTGKSGGRAAPSPKPHPSAKERRDPGEGGTAETAGAGEACALLSAQATQQQVPAGAPETNQRKATHDLPACDRPQASGNVGNATGKTKGRPVLKRKAGELEDVSRKLASANTLKGTLAPTQSVSSATDSGKAKSLCQETPRSGPKMPTTSVPAKCRDTGPFTHAPSPSLLAVAKGKAAADGPGTAGGKTLPPALSLETKGCGASQGTATGGLQVGTGGKLHSLEKLRRSLDSSGAVPSVKTTKADLANALPRMGMDPPVRRITVKISGKHIVGGPPAAKDKPSTGSFPIGSAKVVSTPSSLSREPKALPRSPSHKLNEGRALPSSPSQKLKEGVHPGGAAGPAFPNSQKSLKRSSQPLADAVEMSENETSTQVRGSGLGLADPPEVSPRNCGTVAGGPARVADISGDGKGHKAQYKEVKQGPVPSPSKMLQGVRRATDMRQFNQADQGQVNGAKDMQVDGGDIGRGQQVIKPENGTRGQRDTSDSPDREPSDQEADVPSPQAAPNSNYESDEEVPLTYEVFERLYLTRGSITMLRRTLRKEIEETFQKAVKHRFVRRLEGPKEPGQPPQYWLRMVVDAKWPLPPKESKEERVKPVLVLEDGSLQTVEGLSDKPAKDVWALREAAVLWHRTQRRGRGLPDTAVPLTSAAVVGMCFRSRIYVNWAAILQDRSLDKVKGAKHSRVRTLCWFLKDRAQLPQQLLQESRIPHPLLRYNEEAEALSAKFNSVLAPRTWGHSLTPSPDRDSGAESPFGFYSPEPDSPECEIPTASVAKPVPAQPAPPSSPGPQQQETRLAQSELQPEVPAQVENPARPDQGEVVLESPLDLHSKEPPGIGAPSSADRAGMKAAWQKITGAYVPDQSRELKEEVVGQCPDARRRLSMEDPLLLGSMEHLSLVDSLGLPLGHGMTDEIRAPTDGEKAKGKSEALPLDHAMRDEDHAPLDRETAKRKREESPKRQGRDGAQDVSSPRGTEQPGRRERRVSGRGSPPIKRIHHTPVQDLSLPRRSRSASPTSRDQALRRHYSAERARRRSASPEKSRYRKRGREERRRSRSRGRQWERSSSLEPYAREKRRRDAKHRGRSPSDSPYGFRKAGRDGQRARARSASLDSRGGRSRYHDGGQKDGWKDKKRKGRSSSREPRRGRKGRDRDGGWTKPRENRRRSLSLSRDRDKRDSSRDTRSRDGHSCSPDSDSRSSDASRPGYISRRSPCRPSSRRTDDVVPDPASGAMSKRGVDGKPTQDATTSAGNTSAGHGGQAEIRPPLPLPAAALHPPPLLVNLPPHLVHVRGIGAAVSAVPPERTQNPTDPGDGQPTRSSTHSGAEAQQVSENEDPTLHPADTGNPAAPDSTSGSAAAPPIPVAKCVNGDVALNPTSGSPRPGIVSPPGPPPGSPPASEPPLLPQSEQSVPAVTDEAVLVNSAAVLKRKLKNKRTNDKRKKKKREKCAAKLLERMSWLGGQCQGPADTGGQRPPPPWHRPVGGDAPPLPSAPISGMERSPIGPSCSAAGMQACGAVPKPQEGLVASTLPMVSGSQPPSAPWLSPQPPPAPWQPQAYLPPHATTYAAQPYQPGTALPAHAYSYAGDNPGYYDYHGQWHPSSQHYPPWHYPPADPYSAASHAAVATAAPEFDPTRPGAGPGPPLFSGGLRPPHPPIAAAASAGLPVIKNEPTSSGKVGVVAEDADIEEGEHHPGVPHPHTQDRNLMALALVPAPGVVAGSTQPASVHLGEPTRGRSPPPLTGGELAITPTRGRPTRRVVRKPPGPDTNADPPACAGPRDSYYSPAQQPALSAPSVAPPWEAAHSAWPAGPRRAERGPLQAAGPLALAHDRQQGPAGWSRASSQKLRDLMNWYGYMRHDDFQHVLMEASTLSDQHQEKVLQQLEATGSNPNQSTVFQALQLAVSLFKQAEVPGFRELSDSIALRLLKGYKGHKWKPDALSVESLVELSKRPHAVQVYISCSRSVVSGPAKEKVVECIFTKVLQTKNTLKPPMYFNMAMAMVRDA